MSLLADTLYKTSYKDAEFFYVNGDIDGGRKTIVHEYPNKDFRFVEDLGKNLRKFGITGIISGFYYHDNKARLEIALNDPGIGILVHPFLGNINCVCTSYSVSEDLSNLGSATFRMNFAEANPSTFPTAATNNYSQIADLYRKIYTFVKDDLNGQYIANYTRNIFFSAQKLRDLSDTLLLISTSTNSLNTSNTDFRNTLKNFSKNAFKIASPHGDIGGNISDLMSSFDDLSAEGAIRYDASSRIFNFGSTDIFTNGVTNEIITNNNNQKLMNGTINALIFTNLIDAAKDITYKNENELNQTADDLDIKYDELINNSNNIFSNELLDNINELRNQARIFFEQERLVVNKIINVRTETTPVTVLTYQYYGNVDNYDELIALNANFNPSRISGDIKIFES